MKNVSDKIFRGNENTHFVFGKVFFSKIVPFEIRWKNISEPDMTQMTTRRMRNLYRMPKATNTHSQYVISISFPLQHWLQERAYTLSYTYIGYFVWYLL
jgi:hypothetical protein